MSLDMSQFEVGQDEKFSLDFGIKSVQESEYDGQPGLYIKGYASRYNETDSDGEHQQPGSFNDIAETWGAEEKPMLIFQHALDPVLGARRIGYAVKYHLDQVGLFVEAFIPRDIDIKWNNSHAKRRFSQIYSGIKSGAIRGFSVGGMFIRIGKALVKWSMHELSITPRPCLDTAVFTLGRKSVDKLWAESLSGEKHYDGDIANSLSDYVMAAEKPMDDDDSKGLAEQSVLGVISRPDFGKVMSIAQKHGDRGLHDHLMSRPAEVQGDHDSEKCSICCDKRSLMGIKGAVAEAQWTGKIDGLLRDEDDGSHPASHYLFTPDVTKPSGWKLRVKDSGGTVDVKLLDAAHTVLTAGTHGVKSQVQIPDPDKMKCLSKLQRLYREAGKIMPDDGDSEATPGRGTKAALRRLLIANPALYASAKQTLIDYDAGRKAGKQYDQATLDAVNSVISMLQNQFGLAGGDDQDSDDDNSDEQDISNNRGMVGTTTPDDNDPTYASGGQ